MPQSSNQQFSGIFVSYRRDDSSGHAGRLADKLVEHFGRDRIFMDIDTIEPGEDFVTVIENAVGSCEILIAVIGQKWLSGSGSGQLDNPNNFVRLEISTALRRNIRVIPVLVQRASMPKAQDLPDDLDKLTRRNAIELTDLRWQTDVDQLISVLEKVLAKEMKAKQLGKSGPVSESKTGEERRFEEAPVPESNLAAREKRLETPATIVSEGAESSGFKHRNLVLIAGASLVVLLAASILIWRLQTVNGSASNTKDSPIPQPSATTQASPAKPGQTAELKPTPTPEPFREPTLWKRDDTGTIVQIVRNGNTITAIMNSPSATAARAGRTTGDLAFKGTYEGRTIKGTAYIRFSDKDVSRCPEYNGEQKSDLELTLSSDGNSLSGSREDYTLSADCVIVPEPRKRLKYLKTSP